MKTISNQKGVAAVEFGLVLIPLVILAFGITELGRAMYQYNIIAKATRDAVRYLSMKSPSDTVAKADDAPCIVLYGKPSIVVDGKRECDESAPPLIAGFTDKSKVVVTNKALQQIPPLPPLPGGGVANLVTVEVVGFRFVSLVTFVVPSITFGTIGTTMFGPSPS